MSETTLGQLTVSQAASHQIEEPALQRIEIHLES
jgi:hypothetical protein